MKGAHTVAETGDREINYADPHTFCLHGVADSIDAVAQFCLFRRFHEDVEPMEITMLELQRWLCRCQRQSYLLNHWTRLSVRGKLKEDQSLNLKAHEKTETLWASKYAQVESNMTPEPQLYTTTLKQEYVYPSCETCRKEMKGKKIFTQ